MSKSVLYMSMSLDGFITGPDDGPGKGSAPAASGCTRGSATRRRAARQLRPAGAERRRSSTS